MLTKQPWQCPSNCGCPTGECQCRADASTMTSDNQIRTIYNATAGINTNKGARPPAYRNRHERRAQEAKAWLIAEACHIAMYLTTG